MSGTEGTIAMKDYLTTYVVVCSTTLRSNKEQRRCNDVVCDAGHTEAPPDTNTVCVVGPDNENHIDKLVVVR